MPNLTSATATGYRTVRAVFDGDLADLTTGPNGARNPANWSLTRQLPGTIAEVSAILVSEVTATTVDIRTSDELSFEQNYLVTALPESSGGIIGVAYPTNQALCAALAYAVPDGRSFSIAGLIPKINWREDDSEDLARFVSCLDDVFQVLLTTVDAWTDILDVDRAPETYLDLMLWDLGFRFDEFTLSIADKRRVLRALITLYQKKGTEIGMLAAIRLLCKKDARITISNRRGLRLGISLLGLDWILGGSNSFSFWVKALKESGEDLTDEEEAQLRAVINAWKPAHTHLRTVTSALPAPAPITASTNIDGHIVVTWGDVDNATGYVMYAKSTPNVTELTGLRIDDAVSPYVFTDLIADQTRYAVVMAKNATGDEGFPSAEVHETSV